VGVPEVSVQADAMSALNKPITKNPGGMWDVRMLALPLRLFSDYMVGLSAASADEDCRSALQLATVSCSLTFTACIGNIL
jgi:hypothetical protein